MRTVIVLSALSETTMPWRTFCDAGDVLARRRRSAAPSCGGLGAGLGPAAPGAPAAFWRAPRRRARPGAPRGVRGRARAATLAALAARARWRRSLGAGPPRARRRAPAAAPRPGPRRGRLGAAAVARGARRPSRALVSTGAVSSVSRWSLLQPLFLSAGRTSISRSRATVRARATSRLARDRPAVLSSSPVACWKRRPNSSRRAVAMCSAQLGVGEVAQLGGAHVRRPLA